METTHTSSFDDAEALEAQAPEVRAPLPPRAKYRFDRELKHLKEVIVENVDTRSLLHPALGKLAEYDRNNQSDMLETLKVYLDSDRNAQRCANLLYLHRNSLQYRVRRIQEIADVDLENPDERTYLRLSLFLNS